MTLGWLLMEHHFPICADLSFPQVAVKSKRSSDERAEGMKTELGLSLLGFFTGHTQCPGPHGTVLAVIFLPLSSLGRLLLLMACICDLQRTAKCCERYNSEALNR